MIEIKGTEQQYDWGGQFYIPLITGKKVATGKPSAELWLGDHPNGTATFADGSAISDWIAANPEVALGEKSIARFGKKLPFLFKVLDVKAPLSIQVHPTLEQAQQGFALEQTQHIEPSKRNYKDANHKPELMLALSDFWLLHGFKSEQQIVQLLASEGSLLALQAQFSEGGVKQLVKYIFSLSEAQLTPLIMPIIETHLRAYEQQQLSKNSAYFWMMRAYLRSQADAMPLEAGLLMVLLLNLFYVPKGGVIFQDAGIPHAYLEGQNIELMANSDSVLRAGLTNKHIDADELLKVVRFDALNAQLIRPINADGGIEFPVPVDDFCLTEYKLVAGSTHTLAPNAGPCIWFVLSGEMTIKGHTTHWRNGSAFYQLPNSTDTIHAHSDLVLYRSSAKL